jgi:CRP-like cAMP-binding protein
MIEASELQHYSFFGGLMRDQIEDVSHFMQYEKYEAGRDLIVEGEKNSRVFFIFSGRVAVIKNGLVLTEFKKGDTVGEMEVLDVLPSAATVRALENVEAASLASGKLYEIYKQDVKVFAIIVMNLARDMSRRLRNMDDLMARESPYHEWS